MKKLKTIHISKVKALKVKSDRKSKLDKHIKETERLFKIVFERLERIEKMIESEPSPVRRNMWIEETPEEKNRGEEGIIF